MTIRDRVASVRRILVIGVALRALGWGAGCALSLEGVAALVDQRSPLGPATRVALLVVAVVGGCLVSAAMIWRDRAVFSTTRVALWIEEHQPSLEYRLVTAIESGIDSLVPASAATAWPGRALRQVARAVLPPLAGVAVVALLFLALPTGVVARMRSPHAGDALEAVRPGAAGRPNRLAPLVAEIIPPAYTGEKRRMVDDPADLTGLVASDVIVTGVGDPDGLTATIAAEQLGVVKDGDRWKVRIKLGKTASALRLRDGASEKIIALEPITDEPPTVNLSTPAHDSVLRTPSGKIALSADVSDDFGIASAGFEYIVSSGEGESFTFKSGSLGSVRGPGRRTALAATLIIDSLSLKPGDIVHLRAVAHDANDASGPGIGTSETRAIRIARADEYDSIAVDAAAPSDADKSVVSERMLIMLAEALQKRRPSMKRDQLVSESRAIAADQRRLRRSVGEIVFTRLGGDPGGEEHTDDDPPTRGKTIGDLIARADSATNARGGITDFEGGESPVVAVNKPLLEAYNAMWDATSELEIGEPGRALPHMRRALAAIQRARQAERLYLRGRPPQVVVDLAKVRLQGKDKGASSTRRPLAPSDSSARERTNRFATIVELLPRNAKAAADSLLLLRIDALTDNPPFAAAVGDAAAAIRRGSSGDATAALARARRALAGPSVRRDSISRWGIVP